MEIKIGDKLYCKKDFHCSYYNEFNSKRGDIVTVVEYDYDYGKKDLIIAYKISNSEGVEAWIIIRRMPDTIEPLFYAWNYFITRKGKANRIRKKAKQFLKWK